MNYKYILGIFSLFIHSLSNWSKLEIKNKRLKKSYSPFNTMPTFTGGRDTEIKWSKRAIPKADTRCRKEVHWEVVTDRGAIGLIQKFIMKFIS